ncbi:glutathione hydrolase 1 proenzyme-like [Saccostrea echinata]|uniref:glutathione hydrolase 1 proenzyme-like n=1 Tax=Saccostrea echinata TaxID=191078 RepID=UPI002A829DFD|nr:glutathione hydrolase 1 proenzyme-like [Saccostrea echinata]
MAAITKNTNVENYIMAEESHSTDQKPKNKTGVCYSRKFIGFLILNVLVAYIVVIWLATKGSDENSQETTADDATKTSYRNRKIHINTGAVVSDNVACSNIGRDFLLRGGSAADAAIATLLCNGVVTPHSMGVGGGLFIVYYDAKSQKAVYISGRERAPKNIPGDIYVNKSGCFGGLYIAVPGELKAYWTLHRKYGRLPWKDLFAPAVHLARNGFYLANSVYKALSYMKNRLSVNLQDYEPFCEVFCDQEGNIVPEGSVVRNTRLADFLEKVGERGSDYLYNSSLTDIVVKEINDKVSMQLWEKSDLQIYHAKEGPALSVDLGQWTLHTVPDPSGGPVLALLMNIFKELKFSKSVMTKDPAKTYHLMIEATKFAYSLRPLLGDGDFEPQVKNVVARLVSNGLAKNITKSIDRNKTHPQSYYTNSTMTSHDDQGTSHVSILAPNGDAMSATSTIDFYFGSMFMSNTTGIIWNNEMCDFSLKRTAQQVSGVNSVKPGKQPLSSMVPAIFIDKKSGKVRLVIGAAGGSRITTTVAQISARVLLFGETIEEAIRKKRFHHHFSPDVLKYEFGFPQDILSELKNKYGHEIKERDRYMAVAEGVERCPVTGQVSAFADIRKLPGWASFVRNTTTI